MSHRRKAAALKYENNFEAPVVTAAGAGFIADKIIDLAKEASVPVVSNKELTELLLNVNIGDYIPSELYEAAAYIIAYVADIDKASERK
ncbi:flagellar biosynthesis protein [Clostridium amylolyticum]|uniref:Flagellar biosynthesis protein n=1 Tax=Clostridium amylolyticum TaxID=1121298 RepID=A0A1M6JHS4_9CLOT|nr:EscU/YscU/HrcU family type III secretion system export apparatus switch protein [Clostridium amylolyticum]SHJ46213.1 flagellar biosynthesis protein [Clostridium amylolyticum]